MELSPDQEKAKKILNDWFFSRKRDSYITLGGYAGTGKTTLLSYFRSGLHKDKKKIKVSFCAYTGKATQVLKRKLVEHRAMLSGDEVRTTY